MHKSFDVLAQEIVEAGNLIKIGRVYSHYKDEFSRHEVKGFVVTESNDEICVLYSPESEPNVQFVRPIESWLTQINGKPRFKLQAK